MARSMPSRTGYVSAACNSHRMDARSRPARHPPETPARVGCGVAGADPAASRGRHAALHTGGLPAAPPGGGTPRIPRRPSRTDHRTGLRHAHHPPQQRRTAPQRQQRLHGADRLAPAGRALDPHGVLHHPRRPHRPDHRRNPDTQGPRGTRSARHLRRRRLVAAQPHDAAPHARGGRRDGGFRTGAFPVVHHARHPPQPPQNSRYGRKGRLLGWHKYCEILPRRRLHGQVARRAPSHRRRRRRRPAEALHRRLGARTRRMSRHPPPYRAARHPAAACRSSSHGPRKVPRG